MNALDLDIVYSVALDSVKVLTGSQKRGFTNQAWTEFQEANREHLRRALADYEWPDTYDLRPIIDALA